jgi:hypothetical protein
MAGLLAAASLYCRDGLAAQAVVDTTLSDAKVVELVGSVAINRFSFLAARAAFDTTTNPMDLRLPTDERVALWEEFRGHVSTMMRLRPRMDSDNSTGQLYIENIRVTSDSLIAEISSGAARNCRPGWYEDRVVHRVVWVRKAGTFWFLESDEPVMYSESFGRCPNDPRQ